MSACRSLLLSAAFAATLQVPRAGAQQSPASRQELAQLVAELQKNPLDSSLRTKIVRLALSLEPKPAIPEEAQAKDGMARTILSHATTPADMQTAGEAFAEASMLAPWVPDYYFNEATALEKAGEYGDAIRALNFYLIVAPDASDAGAVRGKIEGLRFLQHQAAQETAQRAGTQTQREPDARDDGAGHAWAGTWRSPGTDYIRYHWTFEIEGGTLFVHTFVDVARRIYNEHLGEALVLRYAVRGRQAVRVDDSGAADTLMLSDDGQTLTDRRSCCGIHVLKRAHE